jgi:Bacterial Ig-like domain (group 1)
VPPLVKETYPAQITPRDTVLLGLAIVDSANENALSNAVVTVRSGFFTVLDLDGNESNGIDTTPGNGRVSFRLHSGVSGTGSVQVTVRTAAGITRITTLTLTVSDAPQVERPRLMTFTALRANLKADGSDSTELRVVVKDDNNNPMSDELIRFSSTGGLVQASATTDAWGLARAVLISERINKTVVVTATMPKTGMTAQQKVTFSGVNIQILASKKVIMRDSIVQVTFALRDASDNPISGDSLEITVKNAYQGFAQNNKDSLVIQTDTKGEYRTTVTSRVEGTVTLNAAALGASSTEQIEFTSRSLTLSSSKTSLVGNGSDMATITANLTDGSGSAINDAELRWTSTFGNFTISPFTRTVNGRSTINLRAPNGSGLATVNVEAMKDGRIIASGNITVRVRPLFVDKLELKVTPDNIPVRVGEAVLSAQAYDSTGNVMTGVLIGFRLIKGAGGGDEVIAPPAAYTENGAASSVFKAGNVISFYRSVTVAAVALDIVNGDTIVLASSDTVPFTISGPPHRVSVGANILKGINPNDGTFALPTAAVVTDVNGNLVADGTPVNFSAHPIAAHWGYVDWTPVSFWPGFVWEDTVYVKLPWTDYNNNGKLDPGEEPSAFDPTRPARGEDRDGDGVVRLAPEPFEDINRNGVWDGDPFVEPDNRWYSDSVYNDDFIDLNRDGVQDTVEPFVDINNDGLCQCTGQRDTQGRLYETKLFSETIKPFPSEASVGIARQVGTVGGKALTQIVYVQSDARRLSVRVRAEANGITSSVDIWLPIILSGE